ncbi:hypothetical protein [Streptomyces sp. NPDC052701]
MTEATASAGALEHLSEEGVADWEAARQELPDAVTKSPNSEGVDGE